MEQISQGKTLPAVANNLRVSVPFVKVILEHYRRLGIAQSAKSVCASGLGACSPETPTSAAVRVHCSGCPLAAG
ncbi:hypothetical protein HMPREF3198_01244 [Winkia neuii]|nr:hypothetical protein HMPREF3198_01244 [Winkia neuii]